MKICVIGCGYLGAVHAASMAELGHDVVGIDVDEAKIALLSSGHPPFVEPGFDEVLARNVESGRLTFSTDYAATADCELYFIGVGTPQRRDSHGADLTYVHAAVEGLLPYLREGDVVVGKSTVPVGTAAELAPAVEAKGACLVWNPEFLREGFAVKDTLEPDRIVYGLPNDPQLARRAQAALDTCYAKILADGATPRLLMDYQTAELVKVSANSFLATKISFINAMAQACDAVGADVAKLAEAIGLDDRIGKKFLRAGIGFGGGCLPKDIRAFHARAAELGLDETFNFLTEVELINESQCGRAVDALNEMTGGLEGKRVAVLGAAFKPNSDDLRHSPARTIARLLEERGADVVVTDPGAGPILAAQGDIDVAIDATTAITGADAVLLATEWKEFSELDPQALAPLARGKVVLDGRNALDAQKWKDAGWTYRGIGRR
ncbi:MAG: UDP-glucose/GDP-mannose dehydrogenase family protein [Actinomycetaceae bacterium]|nr:UDP-glucose/GDP-mannose dehydrogenase family protein [Actinomycetaceae bacterium]